jgi:hypothetical protein
MRETILAETAPAWAKARAREQAAARSSACPRVARRGAAAFRAAARALVKEAGNQL